MADRRAQIVALLDTRNDHLPDRFRRDIVNRRGFIDETLAPTVCPTCEGVESTHCPTCRGHGEIEAPRHHDPYRKQAVTPYGLNEQAREHSAALDDAIRVAEREQSRFPGFRPQTERDTVDEANRHPYTWERLRALMYAQFDYAALDLALERLAGLTVAPHSERGLELLDRWLPDPLRAPTVAGSAPVNVAAKGRQADPRARAQRDDAILELVAVGFSYGHIASTVGLTPRQLRRIVGNGEAA